MNMRLCDYTIPPSHTLLSWEMKSTGEHTAMFPSQTTVRIVMERGTVLKREWKLQTRKLPYLTSLIEMQEKCKMTAKAVIPIPIHM